MVFVGAVVDPTLEPCKFENWPDRFSACVSLSTPPCLCRPGGARPVVRESGAVALGGMPIGQRL
eukprot:3486360-Alexandrium_andersonii.AAC.1